MLNVNVSYQHGTSDLNNAFPTLGGERDTRAWNVPVSLSFVTRGFVNNLRARFNSNSGETRNLFAFNRDVAGEAGIDGVSTDPFDWGVPNLSFTSLPSLRDMTPSERTDRGFEIADTIVRTFKRQHTLRFGGAYRQASLTARRRPTRAAASCSPGSIARRRRSADHRRRRHDRRRGERHRFRRLSARPAAAGQRCSTGRAG